MEFKMTPMGGRRPRTAAATLASALGVTAVLLGSVPAWAETLNQALSATYKYSPRLDAERARLRATDEEVSRAMAGYRPNISGSADITHTDTRSRPAGLSNGGNTSKAYSINLVQPLFRGFQTTNAVNEAESAVRAGRESLRDVERQVLLDAVIAYMDVVRDQALVRLQENNVNVLSRELKATQDRFAVGEVTRTDVSQAIARRSGSVSQLDLARANLKTSRGAYERTTGSPPSNVSDPPVPEKLLPKSLDEAIGIGQRENALLVAALYREQGARYTVERIRGELLPSVTLEASYAERFDPSRQTEETETGIVAGRMTVPIYQGGEVHARVRQAKHTHVSRMQEIEQVRTEVRQSVVAAWSQLQAARAQLISDKTQVDANQTALAGVREEEKVGQRTLLDVLNAEQELLNSQVTLETTRRNLIVASYAVISAIGRLDSATIGTAAQVYDPEQHYLEVRRKWWGLSITHEDGRRERVDLWDSHGRHQPVK
jgi:outer membrane protein